MNTFPSCSRFLLLSLLIVSTFAYAQKNTDVVIRSTGSRESLRAKIRAMGGTIRHEFNNVNAVSATVPATALVNLSSVPEFKVRKAPQVLAPKPHAPKGFKGVVQLQATGHRVFDAATLIKSANTLPADYTFNNTLINAAPVQAGGDLGQNVIVAVIDSGTANNGDVVPALSDTVIGGESLVPADEDPVTSATSTSNGPHGTWVGTMIAGHAGFVFSTDSCLVQSVKLNAPNSLCWTDLSSGCRRGTRSFRWLA